MHQSTLRLLASLFFLAAGSSMAYADSHVTVGNSPSFFQGTYGTPNNIDIYYDSTWVQYQKGTASVKLTIPYESIQNLPAGSTVSGGAVVGGKSGQTRNVSGLGDVWLKGSDTLWKADGLMPSITPYGKVKFGTASKTSGLGTGKNDYEAGVGFQQALSPTLFPFASVGYRVVGNPSGYSLKNLWTYKIGATYAVTGANFLTALISGTSAVQSGQRAPSDFIVAWNYNTTTAGSGFQVFVDKGLSNTTSDYGIGLAAQYVF